MSNKKLPSQASYEELLAALEKEDIAEARPETEEILEFKNNIVPFLSYYNIIPGTHPVSKKLLYRLYTSHVDDPNEPLSFHRAVGEYLPNYSNRSGKFYQLNIDQFKVSQYILNLFNNTTVSKDKSNTYRKHFEKFLAAKNIKDGEKWIEGFIIFEIYQDYCRDRKKKSSFSYENFHKMLKVYFKNQRKTSNRSLWFRVNEETTNYFTQEQTNEIKARRSKKKR